MTKAKKIIQVPMEDELLQSIDATAGVVAESRAAFIREACKQRLKNCAPKNWTVSIRKVTERSRKT